MKGIGTVKWPITLHGQSGNQMQREKDSSTQFTFSFSSFLVNLNPQTMAWCQSHSGWFFPTQLNLFGNIFMSTPWRVFLGDSDFTQVDSEFSHHFFSGAHRGEGMLLILLQSLKMPCCSVAHRSFFLICPWFPFRKSIDKIQWLIQIESLRNVACCWFQVIKAHFVMSSFATDEAYTPGL